MQDANFNVTALVNTSGAVVERVQYDPYGKHTLYTGAWATQAATVYNNQVLFGSYKLEPEVGVYQVRNRFYHVSLGRWLERDPLSYVDGFNQYEALNNAPLDSLDAFGLAAETYTFSGINNYNNGAFSDYVRKGAGIQDENGFASKLGAGSDYWPGGDAAEQGGGGACFGAVVGSLMQRRTILRMVS